MVENPLAKMRAEGGTPEDRKFFWTGGPVDVADRTWFASQGSGVTAFETDDGLVLVDSGLRVFSAVLAKRIREKTDAPVLIAKGIDSLALRIRELAEEHDIAIVENKPDEVMRWYDQRKSRSNLWHSGGSLDDHVADAVKDSHPDRAIAIWKDIAEAFIAKTNTKSYEQAASRLRKVHKTLETQAKEQEWQSYLDELRQTNKRKWRLIEILDNLTGRRIIDS